MMHASEGRPLPGGVKLPFRKGRAFDAKRAFGLPPSSKQSSTFFRTFSSMRISGGQGRLKPSPGNFFVASMPSLLPRAISLVEEARRISLTCLASPELMARRSCLVLTMSRKVANRKAKASTRKGRHRLVANGRGIEKRAGRACERAARAEGYKLRPPRRMSFAKRTGKIRTLKAK
jgi:hypothetical protein